eukprot:12863606-Alexandrium_andersonii.AAC.1
MSAYSDSASPDFLSPSRQPDGDSPVGRRDGLVPPLTPQLLPPPASGQERIEACLLYTSDAADDM